MSTPIPAKAADTKPQRPKTSPETKAAPKTQQPSGLSREEIRQIVIDMIG